MALEGLHLHLLQPLELAVMDVKDLGINMGFGASPCFLIGRQEGAAARKFQMQPSQSDFCSLPGRPPSEHFARLEFPLQPRSRTTSRVEVNCRQAALQDPPDLCRLPSCVK